MAEDLKYELDIEYKKFIDGSRQANKALVDMDKRAKKTDASLDDLYNSGLALGTQMTKTAKGVNTANKSFRAMKGATSQLSFQLQDIAVQAQMGTDSLIILGQQGPQIASIFGAGGAVVGALIAVGALLAGAFSSSVGKAEESLDGLIERVNELGVAETELLRVKLSEEILRMSEEVRGAEAEVSVLNDELEKQRSTLKSLSDGTATGWLTDFLPVADQANEKINELSRELIEAKGNTERITATYEKYKQLLSDISNGNIEHANALKKSTEEFNDLSKSLALQIELVGKSEVEQAKIAAAYQLGSEATKEQKQAVDTLIEAYYRELEATNLRKEAQAQTTKEAEKNAQLIESLSNAYEVAALKAGGYNKEAFILAQTQKLAASATDEQIAKTKELSAALFESQQMRSTEQGQAFLDNLLSQQATELELIGIHEQAKLDQAMEFYSQGQTTFQQYQNSLTAIGENAAAARMALDKKENDLKLSGLASMFGNLSVLMNTESRKMFEIGKTAAIAETIVSTYSSAQKSYDAMASIPYVGPALGAAAAAAAIVGGLARVSAIESQSFSRGSVSATGGDLGVPSAPSAPEASQQQANRLDINFTGVSDSKVGFVLAEVLNDSIAEGAQIITVNQS